MTPGTERLEALVIARVHANAAKLALGELVKPLARFAPAELTAAAWRDRLAQVVDGLRARGVLDADHRLIDAGELARRIGDAGARSWAELSDRVLPALALGIAADDAKLRARLDGRDAWAAAIVGRALGLWLDGPPPSLAGLCDALIWREHELPGKPKRCPPELRAVYVQRQLGSEAGLPERGVRLLAAREVGAPRPELRALRDALVRGWLAGRVLGPAARPDAVRTAVRAASAAAPGDGHGPGPASEPRAQPQPSRDATPAIAAAGAADRGGSAAFADGVERAARATAEGWFGDRKVFVSAVWDQLRRDPGWAPLALDDFKARLVAAHRAGLLELARADLVAAMDPALVAASEITADGASFHFVVPNVPDGPNASDASDGTDASAGDAGNVKEPAP
jgi:hypothetical protein